MKNRTKLSQWLVPGVVGLFILIGNSASAGVVFDENFDDEVADGWMKAGNTGTFSISDGVLKGTDNEVKGWNIDYVSMPKSFVPFSTANAGCEIVTLSFDFRVDDYSIPLGSPETFRFIFQAIGNYTRYNVGLGYASVGSENKVFLYAYSGTKVAPFSFNAIGYQNGSWMPGFDLGSDVSKGTGGAFFHFTMTYNSKTGDMQIKVVNLDTGDASTYSDTWGPYTIDSSVGGALFVVTGAASTGTVMIDNTSMSVGPESR
ncbi:MAG: hypothetical protein AB7E95_03025 [Kiritimatiellales bacterium]